MMKTSDGSGRDRQKLEFGRKTLRNVLQIVLQQLRLQSVERTMLENIQKIGLDVGFSTR